jgi:D-alanyl-D-alanine carboxypeptidase
MSNVASKILSFINLSYFRSLIYKIRQRTLDVKSRENFVNLMNQKSKSLGMNNTHWINPSGLGEKGVYSTSTAHDLALMGVYAYQNESLRLIWSTREYDVNIMRPYLPFIYKSRRLYISSTVQSKWLESRYPILGGKTGAGDGYFNLLIISELPPRKGELISICIMGADSEYGRFEAAREVLDYLNENIENQNNCNITKNFKSCKSACVYKIPIDNESPDCILNWNADVVAPTMSIAKVMTMLCFLDAKINIEDFVTVVPYDIEDAVLCSGAYFNSWYKIKLKDIVYATMLPSSNQAANILARYIGRINY